MSNTNRNDGKTRHSARQHGHWFGVARIDGCRVADIGSRIDAYRAWSGLTDSHDVGKFRGGDPIVRAHHVIMNHRNHSVAATEAEDAYLEECEK